MAAQQMLLGYGGSSAATDIASLHDVSPTASTSVAISLNQDYATTNVQPSASGWGDFPYSTTTGIFIS